MITEMFKFLYTYDPYLRSCNQFEDLNKSCLHELRNFYVIINVGALTLGTNHTSSSNALHNLVFNNSKMNYS